jgi:hypothetical protein
MSTLWDEVASMEPALQAEGAWGWFPLDSRQVRLRLEDGWLSMAAPVAGEPVSLLWRLSSLPSLFKMTPEGFATAELPCGREPSGAYGELRPALEEALAYLESGDAAPPPERNEPAAELERLFEGTALACSRRGDRWQVRLAGEEEAPAVAADFAGAWVRLATTIARPPAGDHVVTCALGHFCLAANARLKLARIAPVEGRTALEVCLPPQSQTPARLEQAVRALAAERAAVAKPCAALCDRRMAETYLDFHWRLKLQAEPQACAI